MGKVMGKGVTKRGGRPFHFSPLLSSRFYYTSPALNRRKMPFMGMKRGVSGSGGYLTLRRRV
jgi:hypothetical protein